MIKKSLWNTFSKNNKYSLFGRGLNLGFWVALEAVGLVTLFYYYYNIIIPLYYQAQRCKIKKGKRKHNNLEKQEWYYLMQVANCI